MELIARRALTVVVGLAVATGTTVAAAVSAAAADPMTFVASSSVVDVTVEWSDTTISPGDEITVTVDVTNISDQDIAGFAYDAVPLLNERDAYFSAVECTFVTGPGECQLTGGLLVRLPVPAGQTRVATVNLTVRDDLAPGAYEFANRGPYSPQGFDLTVVDAVPEADLSVDLTAVAGPLLSSAVDYTVITTNAGPDDVTAASVVTSLPLTTVAVSGLDAGCTYDALAKDVTCTTGAIADASTGTNTFRAIQGLLSIGLPLNAASQIASSTPSDPDPTNDSDTAACVVVTGVIVLC